MREKKTKLIAIKNVNVLMKFEINWKFFDI